MATHPMLRTHIEQAAPLELEFIPWLGSTNRPLLWSLLSIQSPYIVNAITVHYQCQDRSEYVHLLDDCAGCPMTRRYNYISEAVLIQENNPTLTDTIAE